MMNCFVASAFDHEDVDAIYDYAIRPVLKEFKLRPFRVDRVEHNEDIDDRIFRLIDQSQLCIADLTFARPSVYYEAGYAFGSGKPVIYIARRDHFRAREDDEAGNRRVHFDLQMKNIIPWTIPNDALRMRLRSRLKHVLRPLFREQQKNRKILENAKRFAALSQNERFTAILQKGRSLLYSRGYRKSTLSLNMSYERDPHYRQFYKKVGDKYCRLHLLTRPAINKTALKWLHFYEWAIPRELKEQCKQIESLCVVASIRSVRPTTLTTLLPNWTPTNGYVFTKNDTTGFRDNIPLFQTVAFVDGVKSIEDFADRFRSVIDTTNKANKSLQPTS
jgi:hypothetical protein